MPMAAFAEVHVFQRRRSLSSRVGALGFVVLGCWAPPSPQPDAGSVVDLDAGPPPADAGPPPADAGPLIAASSIIVRRNGVVVSTFNGAAMQRPVGGSGNGYDIHEPQISVSDANECGGSTLPALELTLDVYAYSLPNGAIPGTYSIGDSVGTSPVFCTFWVNGVADWRNSPTGSIALTRVDSSVAVGSFDATSPTTDGGTIEFSGSFTAPFCPGQ